MSSVNLQDLKDEFELKLWTENVDITDIELMLPDINRPALQLAGFFDYFDSNRAQIIGLVEYTYLQKLDKSVREDRLKRIFDCKIPCIILCRGLEPFEEMLIYGEYYNVPVFGCDLPTTEFTGEIIRWLKVKLATLITVHGVLIDIYGEGVLIMGESGIGKSEAALELIKRGHRLVADDSVEVKRVSAQTLIGSCPEIIRYFIELRGVGIIDIRQMFGVEAVKATQSIDLIINLENWDDRKEYDRLGLNEKYMDILGNKIICHDIPVRPGRNIAIICEAAAVNHRQKKMGYNAAQVLEKRLSDITNGL